jgi:hypothetical protein
MQRNARTFVGSLCLGGCDPSHLPISVEMTRSCTPTEKHFVFAVEDPSLNFLRATELILPQTSRGP